MQCETARSKKKFLFDILQYQLHEENLLFDADLIKKTKKHLQTTELEAAIPKKISSF